MSRRQFLILLGVWNMAFLFLGFPSSWNKVLAVVSGVLIVMIAYRIGHDRSLERKTRESHPYTEHRSDRGAGLDQHSGPGMNDINSTHIQGGA